jgi:adenosylcobinamide kinase/adenosylcobinamide-phosphate guanylyltransferase
MRRQRGVASFFFIQEGTDREVFMNARLILVLGGARSGKSEFAEALASHMEGHHVYIATCRPMDEEMTWRITEHQKRRGPSWETVDMMHGWLPEGAEALQKGDIILLDSLTMMTGNFLMDNEADTAEKPFSEKDSTRLTERYKDMIRAILASFKKTEGRTLIIVSDEVGLGIVPASPSARLFRDLLGLGNRMIAEQAEEVYTATAGIVREIKKEAVPWPE